MSFGNWVYRSLKFKLTLHQSQQSFPWHLSFPWNTFGTSGLKYVTFRFVCRTSGSDFIGFTTVVTLRGIFQNHFDHRKNKIRSMMKIQTCKIKSYGLIEPIVVLWQKNEPHTNGIGFIVRNQINEASIWLELEYTKFKIVFSIPFELYHSLFLFCFSSSGISHNHPCILVFIVKIGIGILERSHEDVDHFF